MQGVFFSSWGVTVGNGTQRLLAGIAASCIPLGKNTGTCLKGIPCVRCTGQLRTGRSAVQFVQIGINDCCVIGFFGHGAENLLQLLGNFTCRHRSKMAGQIAGISRKPNWRIFLIGLHGSIAPFPYDSSVVISLFRCSLFCFLSNFLQRLRARDNRDRHAASEMPNRLEISA